MSCLYNFHGCAQSHLEESLCPCHVSTGTVSMPVSHMHWNSLYARVTFALKQSLCPCRICIETVCVCALGQFLFLYPRNNLYVSVTSPLEQYICLCHVSNGTVSLSVSRHHWNSLYVAVTSPVPLTTASCNMTRLASQINSHCCRTS